MNGHSRAQRNREQAFTLLELLVVVAVIGILSSLVIPGLQAARISARRARCQSNLKQMHLAFTMYMDDHDGEFFAWREPLPEGVLWYWGLEYEGGGEGDRKIDRSRARLAPYFPHTGAIETCPSLSYGSSDFKMKFDCATYGYGINIYMLAGSARNRESGVRRFDQVSNPSETIVWGDAAQINTWQSPASPSHPMIEEWYYLDAMTPPKFHFRHGEVCNVVMADGHVMGMRPHYLDDRCDGLCGFIEPRGQDYYLRLVK